MIPKPLMFSAEMGVAINLNFTSIVLGYMGSRYESIIYLIEQR